MTDFNSDMGRIMRAALALGVSALLVGFTVKQAHGPTPEEAAVARLGAELTGDVKLDPRHAALASGKSEFLETYHAPAVRARLARTLHAQIARFEDSIACDVELLPGWHVCRLLDTGTFVGVSAPAVVGDTALVYVSTWRRKTTGITRMYASQNEVKLVRDRAGWKVVSEMVVAVE